MNTSYPFIHERKKKDVEPLPLYIELYPMPLEKLPEEEKEEEKRIIIIELWLFNFSRTKDIFNFFK